MRILHLEASPGWGGQEIRILREAEGMAGRGHEVFLGVVRGGGLVAQARKAGFTVYELNFKRWAWPLCLIQLIQIIRRHGIELVNTHSSLDSWIGGMAARLAGCSIVRTRHLSTAIRSGLNSRLLYGYLADFVVTTCSAIIPMICNQSGKKAERCRSIATGVDPEKIVFEEAQINFFRKKIGAQFLVGTACFMRSWKGIEDLLKAADQLRNIEGLKWVVIGGGHADRYKALAREMKLDEIVYFTGHLENPFSAMAALDAFTLLSTAHEGVSQAILQAAYLGKPLIATATGGLCEVCLDGLTGIQVGRFSPAQVAKAVLELMENPHLRKQYGQRAKKLIEEKFTFLHTLNQMEEVYQKVWKRMKK
ncbi:MAG TPA: glycosyltransferase family 4 protein [Chlamydiales bacterium]|nr:glycosyltransferase family 4 protein [Chlamydiales bacterium]